MIILTWEETNSNNQKYQEIWKIDSNDQNEIDEILDAIENGDGQHLKCSIEFPHSLPDNFFDAGGFANKLLSVEDENGNNMSFKVKEWYGN